MNVLVVGGNAAGMTAASRARRVDPRLDIVVLEKSGSVSYSTCGTPYMIAGEVDAGDLIAMTPARFKEERRITVHTGVEVSEVLPSRRRVIGKRSDTGERVEYGWDRLLIATGVRPRVPGIPGTDLDGVFGLVNLDDAIRLRSRLGETRRVAIVGGGYVGLEMAESLRKLGKRVTIFEQRSHVMPSMDPDMSRIVEYELERYGVGLRLGSRVDALVGHDGRISGLKARGGLGTAPADAVLLDTGVLPDVGLAEAAGIRIGPLGGIQVNEYMETSSPGVFAAGNCVETYCRLRKRPILHHLGTVAAKQGRVAGENLAGRRATFAGTVGTTILKVFELGVAKTGLSEDEARAERLRVVSARIEALDRASYFPGAGKVWIKMLADRESKKIVGVQAVGYGDVARPIDVAAAAITGSLRVDDVLQLDLAYTPPYGRLWDPLLIAAQAVARRF